MKDLKTKILKEISIKDFIKESSKTVGLINAIKNLGKKKNYKIKKFVFCTKNFNDQKIIAIEFALKNANSLYLSKSKALVIEIDGGVKCEQIEYDMEAIEVAWSAKNNIEIEQDDEEGDVYNLTPDAEISRIKK